MTTLPLFDVAPNIKRLVCPMGRFTPVNAWIIGMPGRQAIVDTGPPDFGDSLSLGTSRGRRGTHWGPNHRLHTHASGPRWTGPVPDAAPWRTAADDDKEHEHLAAQCSASRKDSHARHQLYLKRLGLDEASAASIGPVDYTMMAPLPPAFGPLLDGMTLTLADTVWQVRLGGGHSRQAAMLLAEDPQPDARGRPDPGRLRSADNHRT